MWREPDPGFCWHLLWEEDGDFWFFGGPEQDEAGGCVAYETPSITWMRTRIVAERDGTIGPDTNHPNWVKQAWASGRKQYGFDRETVEYESMEQAQAVWEQIKTNPVSFIMRMML